MLDKHSLLNELGNLVSSQIICKQSIMKRWQKKCWQKLGFYTWLWTILTQSLLSSCAWLHSMHCMGFRWWGAPGLQRAYVDLITIDDRI
jgi:hypothetical protein